MTNSTSRHMRISLKYKLLIALVLLPTVTLGLYLVLASRVFIQDKMAYVYDSSSSASRTLAAQVRAEMGALAYTVRAVVKGYDPRKNKFNEYATKLFTDDPRLYKMTVFSFVNGMYKHAGGLSDVAKEKFFESNDKADDISDKASIDLIRKTGTQELALRVSSDKSWIFFAVKLGDARDPRTPFILVISKAPDFFGAFDQAGTYSGY